MFETLFTTTYTMKKNFLEKPIIFNGTWKDFLKIAQTYSKLHPHNKFELFEEKNKIWEIQAGNLK